MASEPKPDFERYMTAFHCQEPDRVPLGDWHVDQLPIENFMGKTITSLQDQIDFWYTAGFDYMTTSSGILEPVRAPEGMTVIGDSIQTEYDHDGQREWALVPEEAGLRNSFKIIVGRALVTQAFANQIGADGYGYDSPGAAQMCKELVSA